MPPLYSKKKPKTGRYKKPKKIYLCSTAAFWELGETDVRVYSSLKALRANEPCVTAPASRYPCGIIEMAISSYKIIKRTKKVSVR